MKQLLIPFAILLFSYQPIFGQDSLFSFGLNNEQIVYRMIENKLTLTSNISDSNYTLTCRNCDTLFSNNDASSYTVIPGRGKYILLDIVEKNEPSRILHSEEIMVQYLPAPVVYYGSTMNGAKITIEASILSVKYPPSFNLLHLNDSFEITNWEIIIGDEIYKGEGRVISEEVKEKLSEELEVEYISVMLIAKGPDGLSRKIGGVFSL